MLRELYAHPAARDLEESTMHLFSQYATPRNARGEERRTTRARPARAATMR